MPYTDFAQLLPSILPAATVDGRWQPGIGDPTPMGWITTVAYAVAALLCLRAAWQSRRSPLARAGRPGRRAAVFWGGCGALMLFLAVNKQLDLQTLFTQVARDWAITGGWYEGRRVVQAWFIRSLAGVGLLGLAAVAWYIRGARPACFLALIGLVFTGVFVIIRAASFHHVDTLLGYQIAGIKMNWLFELGGVLVVGASALAFRERPDAAAAPDADASDSTVEDPEPVGHKAALAENPEDDVAEKLDSMDGGEVATDDRGLGIESEISPGKLDDGMGDVNDDEKDEGDNGDDDGDDDDGDDDDDLPEIIVL